MKVGPDQRFGHTETIIIIKNPSAKDGYEGMPIIGVIGMVSPTDLNHNIIG